MQRECSQKSSASRSTIADAIKVDDHFRTNVEGIYAIGDVIAGPMLAHKAEEEGIACVEMIAGKAGHVNYEVIPGIIYTNPELAGVGLTEDMAKEKGIDVRIGKFPFRANGRAVANEDYEGVVKFVADAKTDRILGAHILSHAACELIAETCRRDGIRRELRRSGPHGARASNSKRSRKRSRARRGKARPAYRQSLTLRGRSAPKEKNRWRTFYSGVEISSE